MGCHLKPCFVVVVSAVALVVLIGVSFITYNLKRSGFLGSNNMSGTPTLDSSGKKGVNATEVAVICDGPEWECNIRLNHEILPIQYDLFLHPDIESGLFTGRVSIQLDVGTSHADHLRLHIKNLQITNTLLMKGADAVMIEKTFEYSKNEYWVVKLSEKLTQGDYVLVLDFKGNLTKGIVGFYRSQYFDTATNTSKYVVSSKFQPTYARRAFPCMDEPGFKSTFVVTLVKPTPLIALSNMPVLREEVDQPSKGLSTVYFEKSVPMVTYLVVFAIGDFAFTSGTTKRGIPVKIYSTSFQVANTEYAASITPKIIDYFEEYFGIEYPLPKLDIIGIPDFVSGAMEHWGLISFREANLLWQRGVASAGNKQRITTVVAHELAHMWFGNLMTLKWWDDLWLNEGFASYMEYKGVNSVHPDWEMEDQFVGDDLTLVLRLDGQHSSHPIVQSVSHPDQITELFDTISYSKGASVIRMLENFMGNERFQRGVNQFLEKFSFKNAITADLWKELQRESSSSDVNISLTMDTWTRQMGYPVLTPEISTLTGKLIVRQERFLEDKGQNNSNHSRISKSVYGYQWEIPMQLEMITGNGSKINQLVWLHHSQSSVEIPVSEDLKYIKLNSGQFGYFRVKYSVNMWQEIKKEFLTKFSPKERCGLMDDIFSLSYANYLGYDLALDFAQAIKEDLHYVPWDCTDSHLKRIGRLLSSSTPDAYAFYRKYISTLITTVYSNLTWSDDENDPHLDRLLKPRIFSLACEYGHTGCLGKSKELFNQWITFESEKIPAGLRDVVYKWGMWQSDEETWDVVWKRYLEEADPIEKVRLLKTLACTQETWILRRLLEQSKNESLVQRQDFFSVMKFVTVNPVGNPIAWNFYRNEYDYLVKRFTVNDRHLGRVINDITAEYSSGIQLQEMETLFNKYKDAGAGARARQSAIENVRNNIEWKNNNAPVIDKWLRVNYSNITSTDA